MTSTLWSLTTSADTGLASQPHIKQYQQLALNQQLAHNITWQRLLYLDQKQQSKVEYEKFFLTDSKKFDSQAELNASIHALFEHKNDNDAFRCRFPARSAWLIQQLSIASEALPKLDCAEFNTWLSRIKPHKTTLIFATDFMGNPSSMFGHTLLRIDPENQKDLNLVSYALNYAATPESKDNNLAYAWKGLTGKYPSEYSLMSYFHKVKEYGDLESRDLWEYELNLSPEETLFVVQHIWELQKVNFPYYFVSDNCSYALLGLFDLIRPELNLQQKFNGIAVPIETIKALEDAKLIKEAVYRPALETQLLSQIKQHGTHLAKQAHHIAFLEPNLQLDYLKQFSSLEQAKILEMAYDDLYLQLISNKVTKEFAQPRLRALLSKRSELDIKKQRIAPTEPKLNPVEGHRSRTVVASVGQVQNHNMLELEHRPTYHDLTDPQAGHRFGTQLIFFQGKVQVREDDLKLEHLKLFSVNSLTPINPFKTPLSWGMHFGWQQEAVHAGKFSEDQQHGVINLNAQAGYSLADQDSTRLCYAQMQGILQAGKSLEKGWRIAPAPTFGCLNQWSERINSVVQMEIPFWLEQNEWNLRLNSQIQYIFNQNNAVRLNWQYQQQENKDWQKLSLGFAHYF